MYCPTGEVKAWCCAELSATGRETTDGVENNARFGLRMERSYGMQSHNIKSAFVLI